jgi:glycosyltransferase involved in cell wall biosynthesis
MVISKRIAASGQAFTPKVSIGMPVYDGEAFLVDALDTLVSQTFTDFELIISDNCSSDGTESICREYANKDDRIVYVRQAHNIGPAANFRFVLDQAIGEYFMWAASDDYQNCRLVQSLLDVLSNDARVVLAVADTINIDRNGQILWVDRLNAIRYECAVRYPRTNRRLFFRNPINNIYFAIYGLYKRNVLADIDFTFYENGKYATGSEIPILAQVALSGLIVSIPEELKMYRRHPESLYHHEQRCWNLRFSLLNALVISCSLLRILIRSNMPMNEKALLLGTIFWDFSWIPIRGVRWALAKCFRRFNPRYFEKNLPSINQA